MTNRIYYLYICSSLKDSYVLSGKFIPCFTDGAYIVLIKAFHKEVSRCTATALLPMRYRIIDGAAGEPTQARIIVALPGGWTAERFQEVALRAWYRNPSVDMLVSAQVVRSVDMDEAFLQPEWLGKIAA